MDYDLKKRLKYEYENMVKLVESEYVLKVFSYDDLNDSYLMEICDEDISDYLNQYLVYIFLLIVFYKIFHCIQIYHKKILLKLYTL